uniref:Expressed protein n=2 Tax=Oryza sativa subsp. japonica TaxID=39947 RepID=Q53JT4_ORYSJ|nr:Rtac1 [Oryza sativa Japonica Group]ABA93096.2 expressed protein [Oryza sativa Japonica Group]
MPAGGEPLPSPFRPYLSLLLPANGLPRCVVLGNTTRRRRRRHPATGAPAPHLPPSSLLPARKRRRKEREEEGEKEKEEEKEKPDRVNLEFLPKPRVQSYKLVFISI